MTTVTGRIIQPGSSTAEPFTFDRGDVHALQTAVGGWLEGVGFGDIGFAFWNEEGQLKGLQPNEAASKVVGLYLVGPVVIVGPPQNGESRSVTPALEALLEVSGLTLA